MEVQYRLGMPMEILRHTWGQVANGTKSFPGTHVTENNYQKAASCYRMCERREPPVWTGCPPSVLLLSVAPGYE